ncbi:MAG: hypothetical protein LBT85_04385 [Bifidobacteriaceae bacterium]|jgi:hypothetical protein|nr:hypothetical protein [Bifidobacteriaceae bacterium]
MVIRESKANIKTTPLLKNKVFKISTFAVALSLLVAGMHFYPNKVQATHLEEKKILHLDVNRSVDQADPDNPVYSTTISMQGDLSAADIRFEGAFQSAKVIDIIDLNGSKYIKFTKPYADFAISNNQRVDNAGYLAIGDNIYNITDDYVKVLPLGENTGKNPKLSYTPEDLGKNFKSAADFFKNFTDKTEYSAETVALFKKLALTSGILGNVGAFVSILNIFGLLPQFADKEDPVLKGLKELSKQIDQISKDSENRDNETFNRLKRDKYADHINGFISQQQNFDSNWGETKIRPFMSVLYTVAGQAGVSPDSSGVIDFSNSSVNDKIIEYLNNSGDTGQAYMSVLQNYGSAIFANYYDEGTGSSVLNDGYYVQLLNLLKYISGDTTYSVGDLTSPNFMEVFDSFAKIQYDWSFQEIESREAILNYMYQETVAMTFPYYFAIQLDRTRNLKSYINSQKDLKLIYKYDPACEVQTCDFSENSPKVVALKKVMIMAEQNDQTDSNLISVITERVGELQKQRDAENDAINNLKNLKSRDLTVHSNVLNLNFSTALWMIDTEKMCVWHPRKKGRFDYYIDCSLSNIKTGDYTQTINADQFNKLAYAAQIRHTSLRDEIGSFVDLSSIYGNPEWLFTSQGCRSRIDIGTTNFQWDNYYSNCDIYPIGANKEKSSGLVDVQIFHGQDYEFWGWDYEAKIEWTNAKTTGSILKIK